jgi:transposase, IS6 family
VSDFKGRHFEGEIVLWAVRWYCRYGVSYRDLEQMMGERGVSVDHSTIYRWVVLVQFAHCPILARIRRV